MVSHNADCVAVLLIIGSSATTCYCWLHIRAHSMLNILVLDTDFTDKTLGNARHMQLAGDCMLSNRTKHRLKHSAYLVTLRAFAGTSPARGAAHAVPGPVGGLHPSALCTLSSIVIQSRCRSMTPVRCKGVGVGALHTAPGFWTVLCLALLVMLFCLQ